jgi:aminotransferase
MENLINARVRGIEISGIRKFYNLAAKYKDVISLTLGQPDFPTPEHVKEAGIRAIGANRTVYTPNAGLLELREGISAYMNGKYGLAYNPEDEIIVTNGASEALDIALRTLLEANTEVILPGPVYPGYEPLIRLMGAIPVYLDTTNSNFKIDVKKLAESITEKTRCIILPYPSNPTGCIMEKEALYQISQLLKDKNIFILSDEIYSELLYNGEHYSIAAFSNMREKTIVINGLSKSHSMTGWRIGFTLAPAYITKQMLKVHQYNATCASSISQYGALEAVTRGYDDAGDMIAEYKLRGCYVYDRLISMGLEVKKPEGAFYIFPSIKKFGLKSFDFATKLLDIHKVAVVPGDAFSEYGEGYIRISYACSMDTLRTGLDRLETFINNL